ncbi:MAG: hypothetical protein ACI8RD_009855 [Bacillariaceae sp.]
MRLTPRRLLKQAQYNTIIIFVALTRQTSIHGIRNAIEMIRRPIIAASTSFVARKGCMVHVLSFSSKSSNEYEKVLEERNERTTSLNATNWTLEAIKGKYDRGDINLFPNYQRVLKWKGAEASRLILTVLEERFVPTIVVHQKPDNTYDVVDGKQRLSSLLSFYYGHEAIIEGLPGIASKLQNLGDDDEDLNGLTYELLTDVYKRQFSDYKLDVNIIPKGTDDGAVFAVYEDINSGGSKLTPHQLRRAAYYGPYIELIDDLSKNDDNFRAILGSDTTHDESNDGQMVLRAFAVCRRSDSFRTAWKRFLNKELIAVQSMSEPDQNKYLCDRREDFKNAMQTARDIFGDNSFRKYDATNKEWSKKVDIPVLWGSLFSALVSGRRAGLWSERNLFQNRMKLQEALKEGYANPDFLSLFSSGRISMKTLKKRHSVMVNIIEKVANGHVVDFDDILISEQGPRLFDREIIPELFDSQDGICSICNTDIDTNRLNDKSYVHIDHKKAYANGGRTTRDNAQLVHAKCNQSKGAK